MFNRDNLEIFLWGVWTAIKIALAVYAAVLAIMFIVLSASWIMLKLFPFVIPCGG